MTAVEFLKKATSMRREQRRKAEALRKLLDDLERTAKSHAEQLDAGRQDVLDTLVDADGSYDERDEDVIETIENLSTPDADELAGVREMLDTWERDGKKLDEELLGIANEITERKRAR
jgi:phage-related minor tail protein